MTKRVNAWAFATWMVSLVYAIGAGINVFGARYSGDFGPFDIAWVFLRTNTFALTQLVAIGALIELVDQIRWNALSPDARSAESSRRGPWLLLRRWPNR